MRLGVPEGETTSFCNWFFILVSVLDTVASVGAPSALAIASGFIGKQLCSQALGAAVSEVILKADAVEDFCDVVQRLIDGTRT